MLGSRSGGEVIYAYFGPDGNLNVNWNWNPEISYPNNGWRFEVASCLVLIILVIFSILQASCQFLGEIVVAQDTFCYQATLFPRGPSEVSSRYLLFV